MSVKGSELEERKVFLVAAGDPSLRQKYVEMIQAKFSNTQVYQAVDGSEALFKIQNAPPHVLIIDPELPKLSGIDVVRQLLNDKQASHDFSIIILALPPENHIFVEEVVSGRIQFLNKLGDDAEIDFRINKALNRMTHQTQTEYTLHFVAPDEYLFKEGEIAKHVFIVKRGKLRALKGRGEKQVVLGEIGIGEFVGEMAHINHEPRSASVQALEDCELIEIPSGSLDMVLFSRPAWAHALVLTLSKRLRNSNDARMK
ncbi:MAG: cyclic nucleotide-binding domain-containing protein [Bdellovibrionales bacterium]